MKSNVLKRGDRGSEVVDLQIFLAGFRGTVWDGDFGPGTELQVTSFQRDYMGEKKPDGIVGPITRQALDRFAIDYPINSKNLLCPCGECDGFGQGQFKNRYRSGKAKIEAYHRYEYPGIHQAILQSFHAACFYLQKEGIPMPFVTSGYRCWVRNQQKGRQSTNHMGKAIDFDFPLSPGEDKADDFQRCELVRGILCEKSNFQIGWGGKNIKSLEPASMAPTWIHADVRSYEKKYLADKYFSKTPGEKETKPIHLKAV